MRNEIPAYLIQNQSDNYESVKKSKLSFIDRTIVSSSNALRSISLQADNSLKENFIQKINPPVKLIALIYAVLVISFVNSLNKQVFITIIIITLFGFSRFKIMHIYMKSICLAFFFGFMVVFPAALNVITPGTILFNLITFDTSHHFWIYEIPQRIGFTDNGVITVLRMFLRVLNSISVTLLVVFTTPFQALVKSFKTLGVPDGILMVITLAYKYIFILTRTIEETYFALKSRHSGNLRNDKIRHIIGGRIYFIFNKSKICYENTYLAMVSRNYNGTVILNSKYHITFKEVVLLSILFIAGVTLILV